ncbi:hypothetical protein HGRIS_011997 [Hohenbuehelia grisea]|uniref:Uncharacterized protein n=1 Tax=Hohenbuehelia grisea TaxID=104357 RepID=A0ABR3JYZ9_9AGAR
MGLGDYRDRHPEAGLSRRPIHSTGGIFKSFVPRGIARPPEKESDDGVAAVQDGDRDPKDLSDNSLSCG